MEIIKQLNTEFTNEQSKWLLDFLNSNYFKSLITRELKEKLEANKGILNSYHTTDDLYFCDEERHDVKVITELLEVIE